MHREIEAKILNVNPQRVKTTLLKLGAHFVGKFNFKQVVWVPPKRMMTIRVRKSHSSDAPRLNMKKAVKDGLGYNEWECEIGDYETGVSIIDALLPKPDFRFEYSHIREDWELDGALINIDWFPKLEPLVEIEAKSEKQVRQITQKLGFNPDNLVNKGVIGLFIENLKLKKGDKVKL